MTQQTASKEDPVELVIDGKSKDLGEFTVRRTLPDRRRQRVGPFIFFDHMGPADFPPDSGINVRQHPHIGLATITWLFAGEILHRDSLGFVQPIRPGEVNWMTAGRGIVHSEKASPELRASGQHLHGIQTWVALPTEAEEIEPRFEHYPADAIPHREIDGGRVTVIIGGAYGLQSPVRTESDTLYIEVKLAAGAELELPQAEELGVYVVEGEVDVAGQAVVAGQLAVLSAGKRAPVRATDDGRFMLCGGDALPGERYIWWNFVSSSRERLEKAKDDWRNDDFERVPDESDFIPLPSI